MWKKADNAENTLAYLSEASAFIILTERTCGLHYQPIKIVNDNSRVVTKLETSLTDNATVVIYDCHMFIAQATDL
jgi:hypothetical protein